MNDKDLVTTEWIVGETVTLLRSRGENQRAITLGNRLFNEEHVTIFWTTQKQIRRAWDVFFQYDDKGWSFVDCVSRIVMEQLRTEVALAFDDHFRQFGTVTVVP